MGSPEFVSVVSKKKGREAREILAAQGANELVFGVVGHVGSGTSEIAVRLKEILQNNQLPGGPYDTEIIKASDAIKEWAKKLDQPSTTKPKTLEEVSVLQDLGDQMREVDHSAVARALIKRIRLTRAVKQGLSQVQDGPIKPDGKKRAYILESIRHPAEVHLLRNVYGASFALIGVVCHESKRLTRIGKKYDDAGEKHAQEFMNRDAKAPVPHGQRVSDAFHLSDFFIDNSAERLTDSQSNPEWTVAENLSRLVKLISHSEIVRPTTSETAMFEAHGAGLRSACLSRQVGACLVDGKGNIVATGTNEVPVAGGGLYGEIYEDHAPDGRCAYYQTPHCRNTAEQNKIIDEIVEDLVSGVSQLGTYPKPELGIRLRNSRIGGLLEFSRAVHAEMDALLTAARKGVSSVGTRMWVTAFPCHYCARHIVCAGVDEVQFIEPYPKSKALDLHPDSITLEPQGWLPPSGKGKKVLFHPFTGVAPNLYRRAFQKDRELKNSRTGEMVIGEADWGSPWHLKRISYVEIEAELAKN